MEYRDTDGNRYTAESYEELAEQLWRSSAAAPPTIEEWMEENAEHAKVWNNVELRIDSAFHHIEDMLKGGLLNIVVEP